MDVGRFLSAVKMRPQRRTDETINVLIMKVSVATDVGLSRLFDRLCTSFLHLHIQAQQTG